MAKITISDELGDELRATPVPLELVDSAGEPVGRFIRYTKVCGHWVEGEWPPVREVAPGRDRTSEEVLVMLRKLTEAMQ